MTATRPKVVVMGGGTGTFPVIAALKHLNVEITTITTVSDSGGSAGRIRDEFGFQTIGDLRQSLAALAESDGQQWIRKVLLYRFSKGEGLQGHNLGNLILTALQDMAGDTTQALEIARKVFRLEGRVIPVTTQLVQLRINYQDGSSVLGEHTLDETPSELKKIASVELVPSAPLNPLAKVAIEEADFIIIVPGDYYASLMAVLVADGLATAVSHSSAKTVYIANLMTRLTQTHHMTAHDHVAGIEQQLGRPVEYILMNNEPFPPATLEAYAQEGEFPVADDLEQDPRVLRTPLLSPELVTKVAHDTSHRSLLRHDQAKLQAALQELIHV